jgi:succinoglycan biosynthesis protein ExoO
MTGVPKVSVVIPVYNSASTLPRCIRSATGQTLRDIEILIADDASTDDSALIAEGFARDDRRIRVIRMPQNGGKSRAMNRMISEASGEWIAVLDADDAYLATRLEQLIGVAEMHGVAMVADNILYRDAGADQVVRTAFDPVASPRILGTKDLLANTDSFAEFDFGILKPIVRRDFVQAHGLIYYEQTRLAEDFYYLLNYFVAGGRAYLIGEPLYCWTMPFSNHSRQWTSTGAGAWRYNYREALVANQHFIEEMTRRSEMEVVAILKARSKQYRVMIHYLDAQRHAAEGRRLTALRIAIAHPSIYRLLLARVAGRAVRALRSRNRGAGTPVRGLAASSANTVTSGEAQ